MAERIDAGWVEPFLRDLLHKWLTHADQPSGVFYPHLERDWRRREGGECTLVSQCRLIYNFARAFEWSGEDRFAEAARRGVGALRTCFGLSDGEWRFSCAADGSARSNVRDSYGHAFAVLGLATAARALASDACRQEALATWDFIESRFREESGGLLRQRAEDGTVIQPDLRSQNPMMHYFEALLVLGSLPGCEEARASAERTWRFLRAHMRDGGLPEFYDGAWHPLDAGDRSVYDIGHQFEWAFLLSEADALGIGGRPLAIARGLLDFGITHGFDAQDGGVLSPVGLDLAPRRARKGFWEQCEAIRALARHVRRHGADELAGKLAACIDFSRANYVDTEHGGWFSSPPAAGGGPSLSKGGAWKVDYHVVNLCLELLCITSSPQHSREPPPGHAL